MEEEKQQRIYENRARERALYLLEYRDYSKKELLKKLRKTNSEEVSIKTVNRMEQLGLINDISYAEKLIKYLYFKKNFSGDRLKYEMLKKGLDKDLIEDLILNLEETPTEKTRQIVEKRYPGYQDDENKKRKAIALLQRMGYKWDEIRLIMCRGDEYE